MSNDDNKLIDILIGIAIGALFIFLLTKPKQSEKQTSLSPNSPLNIPNINNPIHITEELLEKIRKIETMIKTLEDNSNKMIKMLEDNSTQIRNIQPSQPLQPIVNKSSYKNNEEWEILRDESGDIKKLRVLRDAVSNQNKSSQIQNKIRKT